MSTITQRKKLSKGTWTLIILVFVAVIVVAVLAFLKYIDLSFLANWVTGTMMFGATSWINGVLVGGAFYVLGALSCFLAYRYFVGQKVTVNTGMGYNPQPTTPSGSQSGNETVIS